VRKLEIALSDGLADKLEQLAAASASSPETWAAKQLESLLEQMSEAQTAEDVEAALEYVLAKNAELYKRLA
jgi:predicted transcriptional regulator